jgi:hypothetical protein
MSTPDDTKDTGPDPEQPTIRFRQLCRVSADTLLGVSQDGVIYQREFSEDAGHIIWQRLPIVSSTQLEMRPCAYPGCDSLLQALPAGAPDTWLARCRHHRRNYT